MLVRETIWMFPRLRSFLLKAALLAVALSLFTTAAGATVVSAPILVTSDDAEERVSTGSVNLTSSDMEFVFDGGSQQIVGLRFQNVQVPPGATINSAYIQFAVDEVDTGTANVVIQGEASSNPATFAAVAGDISSRTTTTTASAVNWSIPVWNTVGAAGVDQRTPEIGGIVAEIIALPGWATGNPMSFLFEAGAGCGSSACQRTAEAHNNAARAVLVVDYDLFDPTIADLSVTQTDSPDPAVAGSDYAYVITVTNNGGLDATGVTLLDTPPTGASIVSVSSTQGSCTTSTTVTCSLGDLADGESASVVLVVQSATGGLVDNVASVSASEPDTNTGNDVSVESTAIAANTNQLCYLVADAGGAGGGNDLLTEINTSDFDPATNETNIGVGTGTNNIEAIAWNSATSVLYGADANTLGVLNTSFGTFTALPNTFGTGSNGAGTNVSFTDVDALTYDATSGVLYGVHSRSGEDALFQIDMTTGTFVADAFGAGVDYVFLPAVLGNNITDDVAVDGVTGIMYGAVNNGGSTDRLVTIDKLTGATTDIAQITVPDIEGLGTDNSGQLWGTSGTQGVIYEIDKFTGVGSVGRTIDNGTDYEAVDCFATAPPIINDVGITKTVDEDLPAAGETVVYTITASNLGDGPLTALQVEDVLPTGVSFVSATPSQGAYDSSTGNWFVGTVPISLSASLQLSVIVDAGAPGTTITNMATLLSVNETDSDPANNSAAIAIELQGLSVSKQVVAIEDFISPVNAKAIPGGVLRYDIVVANTGTASPDAGSVVIVDALPPEIALRLGGVTGPFTFADSSPASGLSYVFGGLSNGTDDAEFSNDNGVTWTYTPSDIGDGSDPAVTHIRVRPSGTLSGSNGADVPGFTLSYEVRIH